MAKIFCRNIIQDHDLRLIDLVLTYAAAVRNKICILIKIQLFYIFDEKKSILSENASLIVFYNCVEQIAVY